MSIFKMDIYSEWTSVVMTLSWASERDY